MGVFARLFRRSKTTEETRTTGTEAGAAAAGPTADDAAGAAEAKGPAEASETAGPAVKETGEATGTDSVEIPKQQSSEAADSETGKGART
ncbi:hypothetical protein [Streptomyces sp. NPDC007904]|jgi:hypothetical protein|uniref:hypothetical protein n=1 Tax=Streptomyces sp. NPDC007904 TaxID=3364787 RepID=UPI0036EE2D44